MGKVGKQGFSKSPPRRPVTGVKNFQRVNWGDYSVRKSLKTDHSQFGVFKGPFSGKRWILYRRYLRLIGLVLGFMGFLFLFDSLMFSIIRSVYFHNQSPAIKPIRRLQDERSEYVNKQKTPIVLYGRLLSLASKALVQKHFEHDPFTPRDEPYEQASAWKPCANKNNPIPKGKSTKSTGFILVSANGGLNQQRVAVCNAVVVASLLNATLVLPNFLYSNVWKDPSQFGDIYQEEYFMNVLKDEVDIVKDLPSHLQSLDLEALGSLITDADIGKEAKPIDFTTIALPLLNRHGIVHFLGFGNRLGFDPLSFKLQRLRCKCNFHALKFVPKIQKAGSLLVRRIRKYENAKSLLDKQLLGDFIPGTPPEGHDLSIGNSRYLALHLRFEIDMVAYSLCDFGGGELERKELQAYRETHFPLLVERLKKTKSVSSSQLRKLGRCPLTPEEAGLVLAGIGFKLGSYIYLAGSQIYGGQSRMHPFSSLYPNLVTKEDLLTPSELAPFRNFSSQLAALDFIACATADVFAMTDSGSQLSSLVSGYRIYFGGGRGPTLRPNKKRLAAILSESDTLGWNEFENRVRKMIEEGQRIRTRAVGKSVYRQPRCPECMCKGS